MRYLCGRSAGCVHHRMPCDIVSENKQARAEIQVHEIGLEKDRAMLRDFRAQPEYDLFRVQPDSNRRPTA
jgi:hypothetical protein